MYGGGLRRRYGRRSAGTTTPAQRGSPFRAVRNRDYRLLWIGQMGHSASLWVETIARSWLIWEMTGSATMLAIVNLLRAVPMLGIGLIAGVLADRFDKRKLLITVKTFTLINKLALAILIVTGVVQVWHVFLTAFLMGCSMAFEQPVRTALIPSLVKDDELQNAIALNSAAMNVTRVIGPGIAGALIAPLGTGGVYFASAGVYVVTIIATIMLRVTPIITRVGRPSMWTDFGEGMRYIYRERIILVLMALALVPMMFGQPYTTIMPIFATKVLHGGASTYGWLQSASGVGSLLIVLLLASMTRIPHRGFFILLSTFLFGAFLALFSQSTWLPLSLLFMVLVGIVNQVPRILINIKLLEIAPPEMYGRVMSVYTMDRGLVPLGTMLVGPLADAIGAPATVLLMGGITMLLPLAAGIGFPSIRRIN